MNQTLNKSIKEKIIDNALAKAGIPQRKKALRDARADWAERVRLADDPLVTEFYSFDALYREIKSDETDIRQNVTAALDKARTVKRLLEQWPEAKELLPAEDAVVPLPPAIRREALNEMIGLPSESSQE